APWASAFAGCEADEDDVARFVDLGDVGVRLDELREALVPVRPLAEGGVEPLDEALDGRRVLPLVALLVALEAKSALEQVGPRIGGLLAAPATRGCRVLLLRRLRSLDGSDTGQGVVRVELVACGGERLRRRARDPHAHDEAPEALA